MPFLDWNMGDFSSKKGSPQLFAIVSVLNKVDEVEAKLNEEMHKTKEKVLAAAEETLKTAAKFNLN